ncbi:MAG: ABC transporter permease [Candidatus Eremiobacteraeota bacterium]|nr:ABC transporter permease [Candidatus Eremiobacteraeota bacterium]
MVWEAIARRLPHIVLPPPSIVLVRLAQDLLSGKLVVALLGSLEALVLGLALTIVIGVPLGFALGRNRTLAEMFDPVLNALYAIPPVAFVPFLVIWFGLHLPARIALVFLMSVFEVTVAVSVGAREVNPRLIDVGRSFGARGFELTRKVVFPAALPFVFAGVRIGLVRAINGTITAELFFAAINLGAIMNEDATRFDTAGLLTVIVLLALLGLAAQAAFARLEARIVPWHLRPAA